MTPEEGSSPLAGLEVAPRRPWVATSPAPLHSLFLFSRPQAMGSFSSVHVPYVIPSAACSQLILADRPPSILAPGCQHSRQQFRPSISGPLEFGPASPGQVSLWYPTAWDWGYIYPKTVEGTCALGQVEKEERMAASLVQTGVRSIRTSSIVGSEKRKQNNGNLYGHLQWSDSTGNSRMWT